MQDHPKINLSALVIASHNPSKVRELGALLSPWGIHTVGAAAYGVPPPAEDAKTFRENAAHKALVVAQAVGQAALADDSGLSVCALQGAPGVHSSRFAAGNYKAAMALLHKKLKGHKDRSAVFTCALALAYPRGDVWTVEVFEGVIKGILVWPPRGKAGFGYDPIFQPAGENRTLAQLSPDEKDKISHRARAFEKFCARWLKPKA